MLRHTPIQIIGDPTIQAAIAAAQDIEMPGLWSWINGGRCWFLGAGHSLGQKRGS
jgi:hypothetical protein